MPCDQIVLNRVDLGKASGLLLEQAMKDLGFSQHYGQYHRGALSVRIKGSQLVAGMPRAELATLANQVRVAYAKRVLGRAAALNGWAIKPTGRNAYVMERR